MHFVYAIFWTTHLLTRKDCWGESWTRQARKLTKSIISCGYHLYTNMIISYFEEPVSKLCWHWIWIAKSLGTSVWSLRGILNLPRLHTSPPPPHTQGNSRGWGLGGPSWRLNPGSLKPDPGHWAFANAAWSLRQVVHPEPVPQGNGRKGVLLGGTQWASDGDCENAALPQTRAGSSVRSNHCPSALVYHHLHRFTDHSLTTICH